MAPEEGPVFTEPIIAWRVWRVVLKQDSDPLVWELQSVSRSDVWPFRIRLEAYGDCRFTPKMIATLPMAMRNIPVPHPAPGFECFCGIHAYAKAEDASTYLDFISVRGKKFADLYTPVRRDDGIVERCLALGRASLWGTVIEHTGGYRAQYAYPYDIAVHGGDRHVCDALMRDYQVDVRVQKI